MRVSVQTQLFVYTQPAAAPQPSGSGAPAPAPQAPQAQPQDPNRSALALPAADDAAMIDLFQRLFAAAGLEAPAGLGTATVSEPTGSGPAAPTAPDPVETPEGPARQDVPYINQLHPQGADASYTNGPNNCGPATMAMIGRGFGYGEGQSDAQLINELGAAGGTTEAGTGVDGIARMADHMGLESETRGPGADVDWIAEQVKAGRTVAANGNYYAMDPHRDPGAVAEGRGGHYVAVVGMDEAGNFQVHDPFYDNGGEPLTLTPDELSEYINANSNGGWQIAVGDPDAPAPATAAPSPLAGMSEDQLRSLGAHDRKAFLEALRPAAEAAERQYGVPAAITLAQAALETGWGDSIIDGYNLFGIKGSGPAGSITLPTQEYMNGQFVTVNGDFARYHSFDEAVMEHGALFHNGYYDQAVAQYAVDGDPRAFADNITGIYATDPAYGQKLIDIIDTYGLA